MNPWGATARAIELENDHLHVIGRSSVVSLGSVLSAPTVRNGLLSSTITVKSNDHPEIILRGAGVLAPM